MAEYIQGGLVIVLGLIITAIIRPMRKRIDDNSTTVNQHETKIAVLEKMAEKSTEEHKETKKAITDGFGNVFKKIDNINNYLRNGK
jgi:hypothetical protein